MTDREIIENILEQKGNVLKNRLIEYTQLLEFTAITKIKKSIYALERRKSLILII